MDIDPRIEFQKRHDEYQRAQLISHIHHSKRHKKKPKHPLNVFYIIGGFVALLLLLPMFLKLFEV